MASWQDVLGWITNPVGNLVSGLTSGNWSGSGSSNPMSTFNQFVNDPLNLDNVKFNQNLATRQQEHYEDLSNQQMDLQKKGFAYQQEYDSWAKQFSEDSYYNNYQNTVADMQKAGLNPLALGGSNANSASIASSSVSSPSAPSASAPGNANGSSLAGSLFSLLGSVVGAKMQGQNAKDVADISAQSSASNLDTSVNAQKNIVDTQTKTQKYIADQQTLVSLENLKLEREKHNENVKKLEAEIEKLQSEIHRQNQVNNYTDDTGYLNPPTDPKSAATGAAVHAARSANKYNSAQVGVGDKGYAKWLSTIDAIKWHKRHDISVYTKASYNFYKQGGY